QALSVGPVETWQAEKVSIWQAGNHDNPFGQRLTTLMIAKEIPDAAVPMSLLADHPNVQFNFYRKGIGSCEVEMHLDKRLHDFTPKWDRTLRTTRWDLGADHR